MIKSPSAVVCVTCDGRGVRPYEVGGWWALPSGWFALASVIYGDLFACSRECVQAFERREVKEHATAPIENYCDPTGGADDPEVPDAD